MKPAIEVALNLADVYIVPILVLLLICINVKARLINNSKYLAI